MPDFEVNARRAATTYGVKGLHEQRRLSLLTALDAADWGDSSRSILTTLNAQALALAGVSNAPRVFRGLAEYVQGKLLAVVSELAFASYLRANGASIAFEVGYTLRSAGTVASRDVDVLATWDWGSVAFDVYSPVKEMRNTTTGFIDPRPPRLPRVVADKVAHKFGSEGSACDGLPAGALKVIAVDLAYNHAGFFGLHSPLGQVKEEMAAVDLAGADAVLVFSHYQQREGHPVVAHGILYRSPRCAPLYRQFGLGG